MGILCDQNLGLYEAAANSNCTSMKVDISQHMITSTPWFVLNSTLHTDLKIESVELAIRHFKSFYSKLPSHTNPLVSQISSITQPIINPEIPPIDSRENIEET